MIFEGILNIENNFTEILKNLCEYKLFKKKFLNFLGIEEDSLNSDIYTQYKLGKYGIVDLFIETNNSKYLLEIKIKNNTSLSEHQAQHNYMKWAIENKAIVKYLVPKQYVYIDKIKNNEIYYLEDFIKEIKDSGIYELNQYIKDFIDFYYKFLWINKKYEFNKREIQFIKGEKMKALDLIKDITVAELMSKLFEIVEDMGNKLGKSRILYKDDNQYGYALKDNENIWFGVYFESWIEKKSPIIIWIDIPKNELHENIQKNLEKEGFEPFKSKYEENIYYIYNYTLDELQDLEKLINKIEKIKLLDI